MYLYDMQMINLVLNKMLLDFKAIVVLLNIVLDTFCLKVPLDDFYEESKLLRDRSGE